MKLAKDDTVMFVYHDKPRKGKVNFVGVNKQDQSEYFNVAFEDGGKIIHKTFRNEKVLGRQMFVTGKV